MRRKLLIALAALCLLIYLTSGFVLRALGQHLVQTQPPEKADLAFVLAGDGQGHRILRGGELVRQGYVPVAVVSGPGGIYGLHECDLAIPFAVTKGYPESAFAHFENESHSTLEEARDAVAEFRKRGAHKILVVTSDFHTGRAGRIYRTVAPDLEIIMVSSPDDFFSPDGWWHNREGRKTAFQEWLKTVTAWFGI